MLREVLILILGERDQLYKLDIYTLQVLKEGRYETTLDIMDRVEAITTPARITFGTILPVLNSLERKLMIECKLDYDKKIDQTRKYCRITPLGLEVLKQIN